MDKLLPIGTVVKLKDTKMEWMIIGYYPVNPEDKKIATYSGVVFPFGLTFFQDIIGFDEDKIEIVRQLGYEDEEACEFSTKLYNVLENGEIKNIIENEISRKHDLHLDGSFLE